MNLSTSDEMVSQVAFTIWAPIVSSSWAFKKVNVKVDPETHRIFACIHLHWWARSNKVRLLRRYWIAKAERKSAPFIPTGWKILIYYEKGSIK